MKLNKIITSIAALFAVWGMTSCQNSFDDPGLVVPVATKEANTTLAEFKEAFKNKEPQQCPYKDEENKIPYIIKGKVISSDATGNIYKALYIQDETAALLFSINRAALYEYYHIGQEIVVDLTGMWVGKYNNMMQIGWLTENTTTGITEMGRMDFSVFQSHVELNGLPEIELSQITPSEARPDEGIYTIIENIDEIPKLPTTPGFYDMQGQLIELRNVSFDEGGELTFSKYQSSGENRQISQKGNSAKLTVRTSGYALFYNEMLPTGTGTLRGILGYYSDNPTGSSSDGSLVGWQLLLRSMDDVMFDDKGTQETPYTIEEAIAANGEGKSGWVEGYVVGSVKPGHSVTSNDDIIFGADAEIDNNIVLAADETVKDWTQCIVVELPQGSDLRKYGNLIDNPEIYGQLIKVTGELENYLGMPGIKSPGSATDFEIPGVTPGGENLGNGSEESPYLPSQVCEMTTENNVNLYVDVWAKGYIVGYVDTSIKTFATDESAKFEAPATLATNLLLADTPTEKDWSKCMSVNLPSGSESRTKLNLKDNPSNLGMLLSIKGNITRYVGISGLKEPSEFVLDGQGSGGGDTPVTPPAGATTFYSGLVSDASGWTFDEITVPSVVTKGLWQWDASYKDLKASAYVNNTPYESLGYAVSPQIDLTNAASATVSFEHAAKFQTTLRTLCGICVRQVGTTEWNTLTIPTWPAAGAWTYVNSGDISLNAYVGKKIEIAFKYASDTSGADTWQIKNFKVAGNNK